MDPLIMARFLKLDEEADRRTGEVPKDHPPPQQLLEMHRAFIAKEGMMTGFYRSLILHKQAPYPPCTRSAAELKPMSISQMKIGTHHRGFRVLIRVLTPPVREYHPVIAIVVDEEGTATMLQLYHAASEAVVPTFETLRPGSYYLIKEPYFRMLKNMLEYPLYTLRVDHCGDIMLLTPIYNSKDIRMQGNAAVGKNSWAEAERFYTSAIEVAKSTEDKRLAYLNRSLANLRLGRPAKALSDAVKSGSGESRQASEKALFREATALYQLAKFDQCLSKLQLLAKTYPAGISIQETKSMTERVKARLHEQQTGEYDFRQMLKQAKSTPPLIDCATFSAGLEVRESPGRGRGLFATRKIMAGDLVICEKAFAYGFVEDEHAENAVDPNDFMKMLGKMTEMSGANPADYELLLQTMQKLYHDPEAARLFNDLPHGDHKVISASEVDGHPVIDKFLIDDTIIFSGFGTHRTSGDLVKSAIVASLKQCAGSGLWALISLINHSCIANCDHAFIGDMQIVRAREDIEAGCELFISYHDSLPLQSYDESQKRFEKFNFKCDCALCLDKKSTPQRTMQRRNIYYQQAIQTTMSGNGIANCKRAIDQLLTTYSSWAKKPGGVMSEMAIPYHFMAETLLSNNKPEEAIEMYLKALEALGFVFSKSSHRTGKKSKPKELVIVRWGGSEGAITPLVGLYGACQKVSPVLAAAAKKYAERAYILMAGEKETILETFPALK